MSSLSVRDMAPFLLIYVPGTDWASSPAWKIGSLGTFAFFLCQRVLCHNFFLIIIILEFTHHYSRDERAGTRLQHVCLHVRRDRVAFSRFGHLRSMVLEISAHFGWQSAWLYYTATSVGVCAMLHGRKYLYTPSVVVNACACNREVNNWVYDCTPRRRENMYAHECVYT